MIPATRIRASVIFIMFAAAFLPGCGGPKPPDWGDFDVLKQKAPPPALPTYGGGQVTYDEYTKWVEWGQEWFRDETFGNEKLWTDVIGLLNGTVDVPAGGDSWRQEPVFKLVLEALDDLDSVRGNLYTGNGNAYTNDLVVRFPKGTLLDKSFPVPEQLHTGLDVEAGSPWPIGVVPRRVASGEAGLPYLMDPAAFSSGPNGVGPFPGGGKFRLGLTCALCHYSLDIDWDGKPDLRSAKPDQPTENSPYKPEHSWAIGNQDIHLGWIFALSANSIGGFENSGVPGKTRPADAREWARWVLANYRADPVATRHAVDQGLIMYPRGFADDTPDGLHNPLQFPSLFTHMNWPYNYDGVMLNPSDRNNNVWTTGLDLTQLVALCKDRGGKTAKIAFWEEQGLYSELTAAQYADIVICHSPAVLHNPSQREVLANDILGTSDGVPGLLNSDDIVLIEGVPGAVPKAVFDHPENKTRGRIRKPDQFGEDGNKRGAMVGLLGTRVVTPPSIRSEYNVQALAQKYQLNPDEFVTEAVSMMLDWVPPPPNTSPMLASARSAGLVQKGYEIFKSQGCAECHAGPFLTDNRILPIKEIGTNVTRAKSTELLQALAPPYDPQTGVASTGGILGFISNIFGGKKPGYKSVTLRSLWGSAPYLHDGGVAVSLRPGSSPPEVDLRNLLRRPDAEKLYGVGQFLVLRETGPDPYLRPNAALSLQALLLKSEREKVITANQEPVWPVPGTSGHVPISSLQIQGVGHEYWIDDVAGGEIITPLVAFLLALDDDPGN